MPSPPRHAAFRDPGARAGRFAACLPGRNMLWAGLLWTGLLWTGAASAQPGPVPPCGVAPFPAAPPLDAPPVVQVWSADDLAGGSWQPPACTGWANRPFTTLVATSGRFRGPPAAGDLLARFGAVSALRGIAYWSVTRHRWRALFDSAYAVDGPDGDARADFTAEELASGRPAFFAQDDNGPGGEVIVAMQVRGLSEDGLVVATENVDTVRWLLVPLFGPGEIQSVWFLYREADGAWTYYSLARIGEGLGSWAGGSDASVINRAVAFYRYVAGIPTDQEPPAAP